MIIWSGQLSTWQDATTPPIGAKLPHSPRRRHHHHHFYNLVGGGVDSECTSFIPYARVMALIFSLDRTQNGSLNPTQLKTLHQNTTVSCSWRSFFCELVILALIIIQRLSLALQALHLNTDRQSSNLAYRLIQLY